MSEKHYDFREWMKTYHLRNGRKNGRCINSGEIEITNTWMIYAEDPEDILAERAVADMKVFLRKADFRGAFLPSLRLFRRASLFV